MQTRTLTSVSVALVLGVGLGLGAPRAEASCADHAITAQAVRSQGDVQALVVCAKEYLDEHGTQEARRAFNEDARWKHGSIYVFVDGIAKSGEESTTYVYPPDPSREGLSWGESIDDFGTDLFYELYRITQSRKSGWTYYSITNPATGRRSPKASYTIEVDWDGSRASLGAGIYSPDWPGTCHADEVGAAQLEANPTPEALKQFVRCAAAVVAAEGYFAKHDIERDERWSSGASYVYVMDMVGNQLMSGSSFLLNGLPLYEWGRREVDQFGGRDLIDMAHTFGEAEIYYRAFNPVTRRVEKKAGFLKRVVAQGVPLLVGSGYYLGQEEASSALPCSANMVSASAVRNRGDIRAFVQCAAEYAMEHGAEEARRAFNEDERWRHGATYVFVDGLAGSGDSSVGHVFPPDPTREGLPWGESIDSFGTDYFFELARVLGIVDEGWIHYAFTNPATGLEEPKSSYVIAIDWNGERTAIGAGFYAPDLPGACRDSEVSAMHLEADPSEAGLSQFVRCASHTLEQSGYFAGPVLETSTRWNHGSIYVFVLDLATGTTLFSSNPASYEVSGRIEDLFDGRDMVGAAGLFGETYWYYTFTDPASGMLRPKVAFVKLVRASGVPVLVGAGYNP